MNKVTKIKNKTMKFLSLALLLATLFSLTACSSSPTTDISSKSAAIEETVQVVLEETTTDENVDEIVEESVMEETTIELSEPIVYEGIDMESDLPGVEWLDTFSGVINEPKLVILNDSTNKKVIVENGATVEFAMDDLLAIWVPDKTKGISYKTDDIFCCVGLPEYYEDKYFFDNPEYFIFKDWGCNFAYDIFPTYKSGDVVNIKNTLTYDDGNTLDLTATLVLR